MTGREAEEGFRETVSLSSISSEKLQESISDYTGFISTILERLMWLHAVL